MTLFNRHSLGDALISILVAAHSYYVFGVALSPGPSEHCFSRGTAESSLLPVPDCRVEADTTYYYFFFVLLGNPYHSFLWALLQRFIPHPPPPIPPWFLPMFFIAIRFSTPIPRRFWSDCRPLLIMPSCFRTKGAHVAVAHESYLGYREDAGVLFRHHGGFNVITNQCVCASSTDISLRRLRVFSCVHVW